MREENFAVSRYFCQIAKFNSREYQDFLSNVKFHSENGNFENLKILMNGIPIKYDNSLMKVKKSNTSRLNSLLLPWNRFMWNGLLISPHREQVNFRWLGCCRDHKCSEKWENFFRTIGPACWYWLTSKRAICWTRWQ